MNTMDFVDAKKEDDGLEKKSTDVGDSNKNEDETDGAKKSNKFQPTMSESDFLSQHYVVRKSLGYALIINNQVFSTETGMDPRNGSEKDAQLMKTLLLTMGFTENKVIIHNNLKVDNIAKVLREVASFDHSDGTCFICVVLSHGEEGYIYAHDNRMSLDDLLAPFKGNACPTLIGKPKIFFIQACRAPSGSYESDDVDVIHESDSEPLIKRIPTEADVFMALSVIPGMYGWEEKDCSWFIKAIYDIFSKNWKSLDLMTMMTRVNRIVADQFEKKQHSEFNFRKKQIPCITSMLTKDVYFYKR